MASVEDGLAAELEDAARHWGMDALIEVHDAAELDRALALESRLIGINNRDLNTFETTLETTRTLAPACAGGADRDLRIRPFHARRPRRHGRVRRAQLPDRRTASCGRRTWPRATRDLLANPVPVPA